MQPVRAGCGIIRFDSVILSITCMAAAPCRDGSTAANDPEALRKSGAESAEADSTRGWRFDSAPDRKK